MQTATNLNHKLWLNTTPSPLTMIKMRVSCGLDKNIIIINHHFHPHSIIVNFEGNLEDSTKTTKPCNNCSTAWGHIRPPSIQCTILLRLAIIISLVPRIFNVTHRLKYWEIKFNVICVFCYCEAFRR